MIVSAGQVREVKTVEANRKQLEYSLALISLVPGETYTVSISAVVMEQKSDIKHLEATTSRKKFCVLICVTADVVK